MNEAVNDLTAVRIAAQETMPVIERVAEGGELLFK
jgi:hypothetical protein